MLKENQFETSIFTFLNGISILNTVALRHAAEAINLQCNSFSGLNSSGLGALFGNDQNGFSCFVFGSITI